MNWSNNEYIKQLWIIEHFSLDKYREIHKAIKYSFNYHKSIDKEDKYKDFLNAIIRNSNKYYHVSNQKQMNPWSNFKKELKFNLYV